MPSLPDEEFATKDSELLACDVECRLAEVEGFYLELDIPGLDNSSGITGRLAIDRLDLYRYHSKNDITYWQDGEMWLGYLEQIPIT